MDLEKRFQLIKRNTAEILTDGELMKLLKEKKKPAMYLGTAITGAPHIGYFAWVLKMADFLKAEFKATVLLSDITGALDNTPWDVLEKRYEYYAKVIPLMFKSIGVDTKDLQFIKSSEINLKKEFYIDLLKLSTFVSVHDATKAASEVVKLGDNPRLSGIIYPLVQTLDEEYLDVDVQYGGVDQRKIFVFARESLPKLGYRPRVEVMTPLIPGLVGKKMSASDPKSKIDLLDDPKTVEEKIGAAFCPEGVVEDNGLLVFTKYVIMVLKSDERKKFVIGRPQEFGGNLEFARYEELEKAFVEKKLHPLDLKKAVAKEINLLLAPFQKRRDELKKMAREAYPLSNS